MSSLHKQARTIKEGELCLALNAAEGRLQIALGRYLPIAKPDAPKELEVLAAQDWLAVAQGAELLSQSLAESLKNLKRIIGE